jgi:hypothetical protein
MDLGICLVVLIVYLAAVNSNNQRREDERHRLLRDHIATMASLLSGRR